MNKARSSKPKDSGRFLCSRVFGDSERIFGSWCFSGRVNIYNYFELVSSSGVQPRLNLYCLKNLAFSVGKWTLKECASYCFKRRLTYVYIYKRPSGGDWVDRYLKIIRHEFLEPVKFCPQPLQLVVFSLRFRFELWLQRSSLCLGRLKPPFQIITLRFCFSSAQFF